MNRVTPLILAVALFMEQMDSTAISTALPVIAADIGVGPITLKLALTSYLVALAIFIPLSAWLADRFGPRRIFLIAIGVFMLGSLASAFASSLSGFVAARFLQGMGGAMMTPVGRAILVRGTDKAGLVSAMTWFTLPAVIGPMVGPPVGGFFATYLTWHWIFLINLPIGIAGIVLARIFIDDIPPGQPPPPDVTGFILAGFAAAGLVFGLSVISLPALPVGVGAAAIVLGLACLVAFLRHAARHPAPALDPALFALSTFRQSILAGSLFRVAMGAVPFLTPLMLQLAFGLNAFQSGLITFSATFGMIATKFAAPALLRKTGFRTALAASVAVSGAMTAAYAGFSPDTPWQAMVAVLIVAGFVRSVFFTGINVLVFDEIGTASTGAAAAINGVCQQVSVAFGIAAAGIVLDLTPTLTGTSLGLADFRIAFLVVAALSLLALAPVFAMRPDAGADMSGHKPDRGDSPG